MSSASMAREPAMNPAADRGPETSAVLPGVPESARRARVVVTRALGHDHPAAAAAAACVSELAANAIGHTRSGRPGGTFTVSVHDGGDAVRIAVADAGSTARPRVRRPRPASIRGRGLAIVAALSAAWGCERTGGGQVTWCHIHASDTTAA